MNDQNYQQLRNQQEASTPAKYYSGYKQSQTPQTMNIQALVELAKKLLQGRNNSQLVSPQSQSGIDPSQMNINYGGENIQQPTQQPANGISQEQIQQGFSKFAPDTPLATQSGVISEALGNLSPDIDPKLILALALKESRGGKDLVGRQQGQNNNFNVMHKGKLINYPDLKTSLMGGENPLEGGQQSKGLINILNSPIYKKYRQSGKLEDFFNVYSPPQSGNPDIQTQIQQAQELMQKFQ